MHFDMSHLSKAIIKSIDKFDKIIGNSPNKGGKYNYIKQMILESLNKKIPFIFHSTQDARLGFAVLSLEQHLLEDVILENRFLEFIESATKTSGRLAKTILGFYYRKYLTLEDNNHTIYVTESLKQILRNYNGRNPMVIQAKNDLRLIDGQFYDLLQNYVNVDIKDIKKKLYLGEADELYERLRAIKLLHEVDQLSVNDSNQILFDQIYEARLMRSSNNKNIGEDTVKILISKCISTNAIVSSDWMTFILKTVGDPRSKQNQYAWVRIGNDLRIWIVSILSQGDLVEFLSSITDGQGDEIYQYRKAFWMQFVSYVQFAKIMVGSSGPSLLRRTNHAFYRRFDNNPSTYSRLDEKERSCIYMDFGKFKVIEGTHNAKIRIYNECPIDLSNSRYSYMDFYMPSKASNSLIKDKTHRGSEAYMWQNSILKFINNNLNSTVKLKDILLPEDISKILQIEDHLKKLPTDSLSLLKIDIEHKTDSQSNTLNNLHQYSDKKNDFLPFKEAREFSRSLRLKSPQDWRDYVNGKIIGLAPLPKNIPSNPKSVYENKGWWGIKDWIGI